MFTDFKAFKVAVGLLRFQLDSTEKAKAARNDCHTCRYI